MAGIDLGGRSARRETNRELALVPFIDFLLCLVAFLLVTAVWTRMARLPADANVPGRADCCAPSAKPKTLHVTVEDSRFVLSWREGDTVLTRSEVSRAGVRNASGDTSFPTLSRALDAEWRANGSHRAASDSKRDRAVLHAPNALEYSELVGVMDALREVKRGEPAAARPSAPALDPAFEVSFAVD
jgi:biopolymer transport protein ExbD